MRKNIFNSNKLELVLDGKDIILKRNGNPGGRNYNSRGAYNLAITINQARLNGDYKGTFKIEQEVGEKLQEYERQRYPSPSIPPLGTSAIEAGLQENGFFDRVE